MLHAGKIPEPEKYTFADIQKDLHESLLLKCLINMGVSRFALKIEDIKEKYAGLITTEAAIYLLMTEWYECDDE